MKQKSAYVKTILLILLVVLNLVTIAYYCRALKLETEQMLVIKSQVMQQKEQIERLSGVEEKYQKCQNESEQLKKQNLELKAEVEQLYATIDELKIKYSGPIKADYSMLPIFIEEDTQEKYAKEVANYLNLLPKKLLLTMKEKGWSVTITDKNIEDTYSSGVENTIGLTLYYQEKIYILAESYAVHSCMLHEIGHVIDYMNDFISYGEKWDVIYRKEANYSGYEAYFCESASEYFAQAFQEYFVDGDALKVKGPDTYEFLKNLINNY